MSTKKKALHVFGAIREVAAITGAPHWVGITCDHNDDTEKKRWVGAVLTDPSDVDAPTYFLHSYGSTHPSRLKVYGINTGLDDFPEKVGPLTIKRAEGETVQLVCTTCRHSPDVDVDDLVDVAAMWVKSVFGPDIDVHELPHLADRWGAGEPS